MASEADGQSDGGSVDESLLSLANLSDDGRGGGEAMASGDGDVDDSRRSLFEELERVEEQIKARDDTGYPLMIVPFGCLFWHPRCCRGGLSGVGK